VVGLFICSMGFVVLWWCLFFFLVFFFFWSALNSQTTEIFGTKMSWLASLMLFSVILCYSSLTDS